jgi:hypothetical protein
MKPVGSRKPTPDQSVEPGAAPDEYRVQKSAVAHLYHRGGSSWSYWWHLGWCRWSRPYNDVLAARAAIKQQGFGAYVDRDGETVRLR